MLFCMSVCCVLFVLWLLLLLLLLLFLRLLCSRTCKLYLSRRRTSVSYTPGRPLEEPQMLRLPTFRGFESLKKYPSTKNTLSLLWRTGPCNTPGRPPALVREPQLLRLPAFCHPEAQAECGEPCPASPPDPRGRTIQNQKNKNESKRVR